MLNKKNSRDLMTKKKKEYIFIKQRKKIKKMKLNL